MWFYSNCVCAFCCCKTTTLSSQYERFSDKPSYLANEPPKQKKTTLFSVVFFVQKIKSILRIQSNGVTHTLEVFAGQNVRTVAFQ